VQHWWSCVSLIDAVSKFESLEPAIDPNNRISFLLDWELTLKCNLDCSYCATGIYGGHDNSIKHPPLKDCLKTIDFMFAYADMYLSTKPRGIKYVILNVYGGESLHHPDIVDILQNIREKYKSYQDNWNLTVTTTTNGIVSKKKLEKIIPLIDEFTMSYHTENTQTQKKQFQDNLLTIAESGRRQKCVVLMHQNSEQFDDANGMISWLNQHNIKVLPRQLDDDEGVENNKRIYNQSQVKWFDNFYSTKTFGKSQNLLENLGDTHLTNVGRACCGGRQVCGNQDYKHRHFYVDNKFQDWYCSVNHFFLYIKQVNGEIYVNKDCKMSFDGTVGPIGNLEDSQLLLAKLKKQLDDNTLPVIQCKKHRCLCGLCAPKAKDLDTYKQIMKKYQL
jgi:pyruvate-formate lyase-activating enzyme